MQFLVVARIGVALNGEELLLDHSGAGEAAQHVGTTGLVVGTTSTGTTEGLLSDQSGCGLAVDVEVASGVAESILSFTDHTAILGKDRTGEGEAATLLVGLLQDRAPLSIRVDVNGQNRPEDLLVEQAVVEGVGLVDCGVNVEANGVIVGTTSQQGERGILVAGIDDRLDLVEGLAVDNRAHEGLKVLVGAADGDVLDTRLEGRQELLGAALGEVNTGGGRALLALVLESTTDGVVDGAGNIRGVVDEMEVLAAGLADHTRELAVGLVGDALANLAVDATENVGRSDEVQASKVAVREGHAGDLFGITRHKLHNIRRQASLEQNLVNEGARVDAGWRGLPHDDVTHQSRSGDQAATQGSEIEGRDRVHESLEGAVFHATIGVSQGLSLRCAGQYIPPHAISVPGGLLSHQFRREVAVLTEEVCQLGRGVDLTLPDILSLTQHGRRNQLIPVFARGQLGGLHEDSSAIDEGGLLPALLGLESGFDGSSDLLLGSKRVVGEGSGMFRRHWLVYRLGDLLGHTVVEDFTLDGELGPELLQGFFHLGALLGASCVERLQQID